MKGYSVLPKVKNSRRTTIGTVLLVVLLSWVIILMSCSHPMKPQEETVPGETVIDAEEIPEETTPQVEKTPEDNSTDKPTEQASPARSIITILEQRGGRVDWGTNDLIAHSRYGEDGYYDLWVMQPDGSEARCLTCDSEKIPQLHNGQPTWHPSGRCIVFQSQDPSLPHTRQEDNVQTQPGFGKHNNLWVTDIEGNHFYQLTHIKENGAILHSHFSHDGSKLTWAEKTGPGAADWAIMIADFVETPQPHLVNITSYQPLGKVWYETHAFSRNDSKILFTAGTGAKSWSGFDICEMEIATQKVGQLTSNPEIWDEHAHYSPDGTRIVWASSRGYPYDPETFSKAVQTLKLDYWLMDSDGSNKQRLTYFNEPQSEYYTGYPVIVADCSWSPDGTRIVATILCGSGRENSRIVVIELGDAVLENAQEITPEETPVSTERITTIVDKQAKTVDWSHTNNKIAYGKWGNDWYVDVYVMNHDGSDRECLTCEKPGCPQKHNGNPAWHPSGDYIVFTAEKEANPEEYAEWALPGSGFNCDLWVMTSDGEKFYQLTDYPLHTRGVIHPHFSHDGNKLFWAERLGKTEGSKWGEWALKIAEFHIEAGVPIIRNIKTYQPGQNHYFYESHAFSPDDSRILFCGNPDGQADVGHDIYEMDLESGEVTNLTSSPYYWDEHAQYSPDGKKIAWISSIDFDIDFQSIEGHEWMRYLTTELWIMDSDGSNKQRLTYFNEPGYPEYMDRRCIVSDISWGPDGKQIVVLVAYEGEGFTGLKAKIVLVELE